MSRFKSCRVPVVRELLACRNESMSWARTYRDQGIAVGVTANVLTARDMNRMALKKYAQARAAGRI